MAKGKDTQKTEKKKAVKSLKEKRKEKKEKKSKKGQIYLFNQMSFKTIFISGISVFSILQLY